MNSKAFSIGVLAIIAVILLIAQFIPIQPATAAVSIKDRDYSLVTAKAGPGGETVYVIENRSGLVAVFGWDPARRMLQLRGVAPVADAFR